MFRGEEEGQGPAVYRLRVSADTDSSRLHLVQGRLWRPKGPTGPFARRLEEELVGARLVRVGQVRGDRLVLLEFRETPAGAPRALLAELTGRHANLILLGRGDEVLDLLVPPPAKHPSPRLRPGEVWQPPGAGGPPAAPQPGVAEAFPEPAAPPPAVSAGRPLLAPLSWRIEASLGEEVAERDRGQAAKKLTKRVKRKLARARSLLAGLEKKLAACERSERVRLDGELLAAHTHLLQRGMNSIELADWYSDGSPPRKIELDPRRSPRENVERFFDRYKKLERSRGELPDELRRARERVGELEALLEAAADPEADPLELDARATRQGLLDPVQEADPRKRRAPEPRLPYHSFRGCKGTEIRVGRSARDNDHLTFRHARGNDLWLHTADAPGSHVVLRIGGERGEPDPEELLDAAHLAVHFSPLRGASRATVHVARRKLVHKPRGAKPGLVTLSGGRKVEIRMQPGRLDRLVRPERDG